MDTPYTDEEPLATPAMEVSLGGSRNFKGLPVVDGEREWSNGPFSCLGDPLTFAIAWFAPCFVYGRNRARTHTLETKGEVNLRPLDGLVSGDSALYCVAAVFGCSACVGMNGRGRTRRRYAIHGNGCGDCCISCCCSSCALTQESREIELEEQSLGDGYGGGFGSLARGARGGSVSL
ncbi:PLAC8-domain-containing protein [Mycena amicta]|nr:PLAC8-domain-containing protein [Mycena amicta]